MKRYLVVCLLSAVSLTMQCSQSSEEEMGDIKNKRNSDKARKAFSSSDIGQSAKQQCANQLSRSAPIEIRTPKKGPELSPSMFEYLIGSPTQPYDLATYTAASAILTQQKNSIDDCLPK